MKICQLTQSQSKVFIMKSTNIYNLRASVEHEVWSSTKGANRVLQNAWENKKPGERIIFIFSITHRYGVPQQMEILLLTFHQPQIRWKILRLGGNVGAV